VRKNAKSPRSASRRSAAGTEAERGACLEFYRTDRPVRTASPTQVRQPIYQRSLARWNLEVDRSSLSGYRAADFFHPWGTYAS
jgi:hypothetical protein